MKLAPALLPYDVRWLGKDVVAGLVLSALLVPQGMAYAALAGLPPVTGLYTSILCLLGYALFGPSKILVLGPDSSLGPMIAATILPLVGSGGDPARAVLLASALSLITGLVMVGAGAGNLGFIADLLSRPTIVGYMNGLALTIIVGQLPKALGFSVDAETFLGEVVAVAQGIAAGDIVPPAAAVGLICLALVLGLGRYKKIPAVLVAVVVAIALSLAFDLEERGVQVVGPLPQGLPELALPLVPLEDLWLLIAGAVGISLVALADTISTATAFAARRGEEVDGNREMIGIGSANIAAGLFQGFPVSTSGSRTAVAEQAGAKTQLTGLVGAGVITAMLVAFPALLADLPQPALGALVIAAAISLADIPALRALFRRRRTEFYLALAALLGVALLGVLPGIVVAIGLSVANVFRRIWRPYRAMLGSTDYPPGLHDVVRYPHAKVMPACPVYRFDAPLIFANARTFRDDMRRLAAAEPTPEWIIVAAEPITDIDTTAWAMLEELVADLEGKGVRLVFAELKDPVRSKLEGYGMEGVLDPGSFFATLQSAVTTYHHQRRAQRRSAVVPNAAPAPATAVEDGTQL
jgi:high affinity sulfate transporter 1